MPFYQYTFLGTWDEELAQWQPISARREGDALVGTLDHLSLFGGGTQNQYESGWVLTFNDAHVSAFSGAFTYDYPIQLPEGRGGLTPDLRLNYNSRRVDGILSWI
jgi:hypothetical protein